MDLLLMLWLLDEGGGWQVVSHGLPSWAGRCEMHTIVMVNILLDV